MNVLNMAIEDVRVIGDPQSGGVLFISEASESDEIDEHRNELVCQWQFRLYSKRNFNIPIL